MAPELAYQKFLLEINKGNTQFNIACDRARFALYINKEKHSWVNDNLKNKDSILIDNLREIVTTEDLLSPTQTSNFAEFKITTDFYEAISVKVEAKRGDCKRTIYSREVKNQNKNVFEFDENQSPDFDYEWTFHSFQSDSLRVYRNDFGILKATFEFYKVLPEFDIEGYINLDGVPSADKSLPLSEQYMDMVISFAALEFMRDYQSALGIEIGKDRIK